MAPITDPEETRALTSDIDGNISANSEGPTLRESISSASTSSLILDQLGKAPPQRPYTDDPSQAAPNPLEAFDLEDPLRPTAAPKPFDKTTRRLLWVLGLAALAGWLVAAAVFVSRGRGAAGNGLASTAVGSSGGTGNSVTLDQVLGGQWRPRRHDVTWIGGPEGQDGLVLEKAERGKAYLVVEDVRDRAKSGTPESLRVLMQRGTFTVDNKMVISSEVLPSADLRKVLVVSEQQGNWRHSFTGKYWIFDVDSQTAEPLDPAYPDARVQLASWSPQSNAVVFTRDNNLYLRKLDQEKTVLRITLDGGTELFYGIPDWVYEEEVFSGRSATWWSEDGDYIAFLRTDESTVPEYPIEYFASRPSGEQPKPGEENYPEERRIKYPKAGTPNPIVTLQFYDVQKEEVFTLPIEGDFPDDDRLITEVVWAGREGKVLVRETNRESDKLKVVLMDVVRRQGRTIREQDVQALDGGWFEVSQDTMFIPSDPSSGRMKSGYIDTIIHEGNDHLAYFTPIDNPEPILLTSGDWEVVKAPSAVDLENNWVYFVSTKESSTQRHIYRVSLNGTDMLAITDTSSEGFYSASFSTGGGYVLLTYEGPGIPWQKVMSLPGNDMSISYSDMIEDNADLKQMVATHTLPTEIYSTITIDGFELNVVERLPPRFDKSGCTKYPVLFWMYQGPGSQSVDRRFSVDFQSYVAARLGYVVVTVDGRGTGFRGRKTRCAVRGNLGYWEAHDQIAAAQMWAAKKYVDPERIAIWGWSYGGFMALKVLETDAGRTFKYGMAVAPVTDWRFYDSIYTERYMHTPQHNPQGYENSTISDAVSLGKNVRFLIMHGVADDNVHTQNTYTLLDKLDLAGVENYDVHVFPDSDHGIYFHNAYKIVNDSKLRQLETQGRF